MVEMTRREFAGALGALGAFALSGCAAQSQSSGGSSRAAGVTLRVGTLATEDILPLWVAEQEKMYAEDAGLAVEIWGFNSATELIAGVASGEIDMAMTDIMVSASMFAAGVDLQLEWVTLGTTADQGRFGIMVGPSSNVQSLKDLAGVPIGVGSNTILEYVMDRLMENAGLSDSEIVVFELQKLPVRFQAMLSGDVAAAALPGSLLALGEVQGCRVVADDTQGDNISQSVMIVRSDVASDSAKMAGVEVLKGIWNKGADLINANPDQYRALLAEKANLSDAVVDTYKISTYPQVERPSSAMVAPVIEWMVAKSYLEKPLEYDEATGRFA